MKRLHCFALGLVCLARTPLAAQPTPPLPDEGLLALGSVVVYPTVTRSQLSDPAYRRLTSNLDTLESRFANRFLASRLYSYYERRGLQSVQKELDRIDNFSFDQFSGPSREQLRRLDYLAIFHSTLDGPAGIRVIEVETGRIMAAEICTPVPKGEDPPCVDAAVRNLMASGSAALDRKLQGANRVDAMQEVAPEYEAAVGREAAEFAFWDQIRRRSRAKVLRPEMEALISAARIGIKRCGDLYRVKRASDVRGCVASVNENLDKLNTFK